MAQVKVLTDAGLEYLVDKIDENMEKKVDKVAGKGLSTNDFTNGYKESVDNLVATAGQPNIIETVKVNGTALDVTDKAVNIDLSGYSTKSDMTTALAGKVDKVTGKGLSSNDYTDAEKVKLGNIATGAQVNVLEGVQVNSSDLAISGKKVNIDLTPYAKTSDMQTALAGKVDKADGYSLMSDAEKSKLANLNADAESTYATKTDVSTGLSAKVDKVDGSRLMTTAEATKISKLADDPNATYATKTELSLIPKLDKVVVDVLPTEDIDEDKIYLVPNGGSGTNSRDEYLYINGTWELIGTTEVDISGKADITYVDGEIDTVNERIDNLDIPNYEIELVDELPSSVLETNVVYLMPSVKADKSYVDGEISRVEGVINSLDIPDEVIVDSALDGSSTNAIQNKAVTLEFGKKANASDVYTKSEVDTKLGLKADASTVYTKTEVNNLIDGEVEAINTEVAKKMNRTDVESALALKLNSADLVAITTGEIDAMF